jgi:hypothetical protein
MYFLSPTAKLPGASGNRRNSQRSLIPIQALAAVSPTNPQPWSFLTSVASGLVDGAAGGSIFVVLQRWWNPKDTRVMRLRNYLIAIMFVGVASLFAMTAINS